MKERGKVCSPTVVQEEGTTRRIFADLQGKESVFGLIPVERAKFDDQKTARARRTSHFIAPDHIITCRYERRISCVLCQNDHILWLLRKPSLVNEIFFYSFYIVDTSIRNKKRNSLTQHNDRSWHDVVSTRVCSV